MSTTIVTPEVQRPQHFVSCDEQAIGRRVLRFARHDNLGPVTAVPLEILLSDLDEDRPACRCFAIQLDRVEADLAARRRAQRAGFDRAEEIASLIIARDTLRAVTR